MAIARELYHRITLWQRATGLSVDLDGRHLLAARLHEESAERLPTHDGSERVVARRHFVRLMAAEMGRQEALRTICAMGCPVRLIALSAKRHLVWLEDALVTCLTDRQGPPGYAADVYEIANLAYAPAIFQGADLLSGIPWEVTTPSGAPRLLEPPEAAYAGPTWQVQAGASVTPSGVLSGGAAWIEIEAPIGGATLVLTGGGVVGSVASLGQGGGFLESSPHGAAITLSAGTYALAVSVTAATERPRLEVLSPGTLLEASARAFTITDAPCGVPADDGNAGGGTGDPGDDIALDCPPCLIFADTSDPAKLHLDAGNVSLTPGADGISRFSRWVQDDRGYEFTIGAIRFLDGASPASPAEAFYYTVCAARCSFITEGETDERYEVEIEFIIASSILDPGTYTVEIDVVYDCASLDQTLTFDMTES